MKALDLMTPRPYVVTPGEPLVRAAEIMRDHDVGMVPVVDGRESMRPVGVVTDRDIALRHVAAGHHHDCPCGTLMTRGPLVCVRPADDADEVTRKMELYKVRRVLVTDAHGRLAGVVAEADLLRHEAGVGPRRVERVLAHVREPAGLPV